MTRTTDARLAASLLARLRNLGRTSYPNIPAQTLLLLYAQQGFLGRLNASDHREQFVLKGALSLFTRYAQAARPTEDLDLAARDLPHTPAQLLAVMQAICAVPFGDGLRFDPESLEVRVINEGLTYPGVGVELTAWLGDSRATLQIDVSFGNVVIPAPVTLHFPNLLLPEAVQVAVYPLETVVTEKFAALVERGVTSTRMKDLYDLHVILSRETFEAGLLHQALTTSFAARGTPVADLPVILGPDFAADAGLMRQWESYLRRTRFAAPDFPEVMAQLDHFYPPVLLDGLNGGHWQPQVQIWTPEQP